MEYLLSTPDFRPDDCAQPRVAGAQAESLQPPSEVQVLPPAQVVDLDSRRMSRDRSRHGKKLLGEE